jgi:hypothetical protein
VTYDMNAHRESVLAWCLRLVRDGGRGWHTYVTAKAKQLAAADPSLHGDLPRAVDAAIQETAPQRATTPTRRT